MSDIVETLRAAASHPYNQHGAHKWMNEAADTITALRAENEKLRAALDNIADEKFTDVGSVKAYACAVLRRSAQEKQDVWPTGFYKIERSIMDRCASEGCYQVPSIRMELDGVGAVYCEPCARKIAALGEQP